jgi:hypothetical protein
LREGSHYRELVSSANQMPRALEVAIREAVGKARRDVALQPAADAPIANSAGLLPPAPVVVPASPISICGDDVDGMAISVVGAEIEQAQGRGAAPLPAIVQAAVDPSRN